MTELERSGLKYLIEAEEKHLWNIAKINNEILVNLAIWGKDNIATKEYEKMLKENKIMQEKAIERLIILKKKYYGTIKT